MRLGRKTGMLWRRWGPFLAVAATLSLQGCGSIDAFLVGNEAAPAASDSGDLPRLPVYQEASLVVDTDEAVLPPRPRNRAARRPATRPRTELARAAEGTGDAQPDGQPDTIVLNEPPPLNEPPTAFAIAPPPAASPAPDAAPLKLIGLDENELTALLGPPYQREDAAPGKVWRYRLANCTLAVSLYPELRSQTFRALSYEVAINDDSANHRYGCFAQRELNALAK